ncbi:MAG: chromosome segregation protein SMC [Alphaproteobacteria bacterium]|nr:MAG: chromosome segregation protein SMC [Alphaproteobacteria bacterium]
MKFDRLRLHGFKSFVESTDLQIEPGLTGVVGPNGCGKSNLLEALRWVMGENSPKSMRGTGMEDVIFAGTSGRASRNNAEVTLWLDNKDRSAPAEYNDQDALEVVRRIERDAGSAYKINGKDVRARDVQLLFADASTGAHSPALVKQGQIGQLINAKPKARRQILEEAAGISGLHSRRHEAELRLKAAETNLTRLEDVIQQIEGQLSSLKRQARQASRYRNLSGHIRKAEATVLHLRWLHALEGVADAKKRLTESEAAVAEMTEIAARTSTEQAKASEAVPPIREEEARTAAALHRLTVERENLEAEETRAREEAIRLEARLEQLEQDMTREKALSGDADQTVTRLRQEAEELQAALEAGGDSVEAAKAQVEETAAELSEEEGKLENLTSVAAQLNTQRNAIEKSLEEAQSREQRLSQRLAEIRQNIAALEPSPEDAQKLEEARASVTAARTEVEAAERQLVEAEAARGAAQNHEAMARDPMQDAESVVNRLRTEAKTLARVLQVEESGLWPPLIDAVEVQPGFEKALGAALGDDLDIPSDTAAPIHWDTLPPLDSSLPLPAGVRPLSDVVKGPQALARRLSQIGLVSKAEGGAKQRDLKQGQRLVSEDGDLWRWDGLTAAAEAPTAAATRLAQRNRLAELDEEISVAEAKARATREAYHTARQQAEQAAEKEGALRKVLREAQGTHSEMRDKAQTIETEVERNSSRLTALQESLAEIENDIAETLRRREDARQALAEQPDPEELQSRISETREVVSDLRLAYSEKRATFEGFDRERQLRTSRLATVGQELSNWEGRKSSAMEQIETLEARRVELITNLEQVRSIPASLEGMRTELLSRIQEAEQKRNAAADMLAEAEAFLRQCDQAAKEAQTSLGEVREVRARCEAQIEGAHDRQNEVMERIREVLDCLPEDVAIIAEINDGDELPPLEKTEVKLEKLKRERESLGGVNLRADEEAEEYQERLDSMNAERDDLVGAIQRLRQGISNLNREGRERLLAAFETVNQNFQTLFKTLFVGGEAELKMVESEDPLEAGLEIYAKPPGKKTQVMSLLSGGEQALTAVSLIFAVFQANPAPICVLDEVDAPLDDANVDRFCNLLDEMTRTTDTRFLVITHHALTMSRMNRLYGVTMMERGVSQLVSVDLSDAERIQAAE